MAATRSQQQLELAKELLDDVELSRLPPEQLLLKASRLARLVDDTATVRWVGWELNGYPNNQDAKSWMRRFGRFTNEQLNLGYWIPLAGISGSIASMQVQIQTLTVPNIQFAPSSANPNEFVTGFAGTTAQKATEPVNQILTRLQSLTTAVSDLSAIRSRVLAAVHGFAVKVYHELSFADVAESIFERFKTTIDALMQEAAPDVLEKVPSVYDRLAERDPEAISQAMNTVRRMIKVFADRVYPPSEVPREVDGQKYEIGSDKVLNRIKLYLHDKCPSGSRRDRLNRTLRDVYDRCSAGSHGDITSDEAKALFLQAYLALGEVLAVTTQPPPIAA